MHEEEEEENILYDLNSQVQWPQESEIFARNQRERNNVSMIGRLNSATQRSVWTFLRVIRVPLQTTSPCSLPPGLLRLVNSEISWHIAVGKDASVIAVLRDHCVEIRSHTNDYETVIGKGSVPRDPYPQWRRLSWSPDNTMIACSQSNGTVDVFDVIGTKLFSISGEVPKENGQSLDLSCAIAGLVFTDVSPGPPWSAELLVINYRGSLRSYYVDRDQEYKQAHSFLFISEYPLGVSSVEYNPQGRLLFIGGCGTEGSESHSGARHNGLTAWRILSGPPHYILVSDFGDSSHPTKPSGSFMNKLKAFNVFRSSTGQDGVYKMCLSPDNKLLATIHHSGKLCLWNVPSMKLHRSWSQEQQPGFAEVSPEFTDNPQRRKTLKDLVPCKNILDVNWWSNEAIILSRCTGAVTVSSATTLKNLLGTSPEWFEPSTRITPVHDGGFLTLEVESRFPQKRRFVDDLDDDQNDSDEEDASWVTKSTRFTKSVLSYVRHSEMFQPPRKRPKMINRTYRLLCLKSTTPEELYARKIDNEEYGEALALSKAYGLDSDLVYQRQWRKSTASIASIQDYLSKIKKRSWVLHECLEWMPTNIDATKELLEFGLRGTDLQALIAIGKGEDGGREMDREDWEEISNILSQDDECFECIADKNKEMNEETTELIYQKTERNTEEIKQNKDAGKCNKNKTEESIGEEIIEKNTDIKDVTTVQSEKGTEQSSENVDKNEEKNKITEKSVMNTGNNTNFNVTECSPKEILIDTRQEQNANKCSTLELHLQSEDSDSSEDDIPLKRIQEKLRRNESEDSEDETLDIDSDNSVKDPTFSLIDEIKKTRKLPSIRDSNWKKKPSTLSNRKKRCPGRPIRSREFDFQKAAQCSKRLFRAKQYIFKYHSNTLDSLLASNGFQRKFIKSDGNCFFQAVHDSTLIYKNAKELREALCDYILQHKDDFRPFLSSDFNGEAEFRRQVQSLRENGRWAVDIADALPLAVACLFEREIVIYSSSRDTPITRVRPITDPVDQSAIINLSYLKVTGCEHYDGVEPLQSSPKKRKLDSPLKLFTSRTPKKKPRKEVSISPQLTPRKQAVYVSPRKRFLTRKREKHPETWKRNVRKILKLSGKEYVSTSGKVVQEKSVQPVNCYKCRYKCDTRIKAEDRLKIFNVFWNLESYTRQKDFICKNITDQKPKRILTTAKRSRTSSRVFYFKVDGEQIRVCKNFFVKTLDISYRQIDTAIAEQVHGIFCGSDKRGKHSPHNRTPKAQLDGVRSHIESFPLVEGHYTRQDSNRKFLGCDLNVKKMYNLYVEYCKSKGKKPVGLSKYRKVFCEEYNISFHVPKKDQCQTCVTFRQAEEAGKVTEELKQGFEEHQERKNLAREEKALDKTFCKEKKSYHTATYDLEAVLPVPCSLVSQVYYKRKLCCYNLSIYSLAEGNASCYLWNESEGKRGSCEIGTCLLLYLKSLSSVNHVCFWSDSCTGQNRNRFVFTALLHAVVTLKDIDVIDKKYLETGHTQMECDSMHSSIERAKKVTSVFVPSQWDTVVRMARRKNPYRVIPIRYGDILNFKPLTNNLLPASATDDNGQKVRWMKIKWMQFRKSEPDSIFFKYNFKQEEFNRLKVKRSKRGSLSIEQEFPKCYGSKLPISDAKKKDLLSLCSSNIIPKEFHEFYKQMPSSKSTTDRLPCPDIEEECEDSEEN